MTWGGVPMNWGGVPAKWGRGTVAVAQMHDAAGRVLRHGRRAPPPRAQRRHLRPHRHVQELQEPRRVLGGHTGHPSAPNGTHGIPLAPMGTHGIPLTPIGSHWHPLAPMGSH